MHASQSSCSEERILPHVFELFPKALFNAEMNDQDLLIPLNLNRPMVSFEDIQIFVKCTHFNGSQVFSRCTEMGTSLWAGVVHTLFYLQQSYLMYDRQFFTQTKQFVFNSVTSCLINTKLSHHTIQGVIMRSVKFQGWMRRIFEMQADKKYPSRIGQFACF